MLRMVVIVRTVGVVTRSNGCSDGGIVSPENAVWCGWHCDDRDDNTLRLYQCLMVVAAVLVLLCYSHGAA